MKLIYISTNPFPSRFANTVNSIKMCQAFSKNGVKTELVCMSSVSQEDIYSFYGVKPFKLNIFPESGKLFFLFRVVKFFLIKNEPDSILYTRSPVIALLASLFFRKVGYEAHLIPFDFINQIAEKLILGNSKLKMICISNTLKTDYLKKYPNRNLEILVAHDGADLPEQEVKFRDEVKTIGYIGQLYEGKGINIVIELSKLFPHFKFHILGGTQEEIEKLQSAYGALLNVNFMGHIPHKEVHKCSSQFDIALAPLQEKNIIRDGKTDIARWTSPLKIFEYMSQSIPMVASKLEVIQEIVIDREEAYLCSPSDVSDWFKAIKELSENHKLRKRIAIASHSRFEKEYTWDARANNIFKFII
jgi:glycosyltransferase involved in cell wall biosynthesis